jgi:excisionase family DNA binding protein
MAVGEEGEVGIELLSSRQVANRLSVSVRTVWRLVAAGRLAEPLRYNRKLVRWRSDDVDRFIQSLD